MFAWTKPPMLPTTGRRSTPISSGPRRTPDDVLAAYPDYPRRRALLVLGSDVMFAGPTWAFADAYSAHAPTQCTGSTISD